MANRREMISATVHACAATTLAAMGATSLNASLQTNSGDEGPQRFFIFSMVGSENPTRANFPFVWASALHEAGHEVRLELAGDATVLMRDVVVENMTAVGWPPMKQFVDQVIEHGIPIFV